jgi:hypothetical protein
MLDTVDDHQARFEAVLAEATAVRKQYDTQIRSIEGLWRTLCGAVAAIENKGYLDRLDALELEALRLAAVTGTALPNPAPWHDLADPQLDEHDNDECLRFLGWPVEEEQALPHPRSVIVLINSPPAPPTPQASTDYPLNLETLRGLAYERKLSGIQITPEDVHGMLVTRRLQGTTPDGVVWTILKAHCRDKEDLEAIQWILSKTHGEITVLTYGHEYPRLLGIFQRLVIDPLPKPTEAQRRDWSRQQFVKMAHARRVG